MTTGKTDRGTHIAAFSTVTGRGNGKKKKKAEPKQEGKQLQGKIRLPQPGKTPSRTMQGTAPSLNTAYKLKQLIKGQPGCREGGCSGVTITGTAGTQPQWDPEGYTGVILHCI